MRKPEPLSAARVAWLNEQVVNQCFEQYKNLLDEQGINNSPSRIWNRDEAGLQDHFCSPNVISKVGQPCSEISSGEKGETSTILAAFNAAGEHRRTLVILKGRRLQYEWLYGCLENIALRVPVYGAMNVDLLLE